MSSTTYYSASPTDPEARIKGIPVRVIRVEPASGDLFAVALRSGKTYLVQVDEDLSWYEDLSDGRAGCGGVIWWPTDGTRMLFLSSPFRRGIVGCKFFAQPQHS